MGRAGKFALAAMTAIATGSPATSQPTQAANPAQAIEALLKRSSAAWSAGNLDVFMQFYEAGPQTTYVGSDGIISGRGRIREHYRGRFGASSASMGRLTIEPETIRPLGRDFALVTGHYSLTRPADTGRSRRGVFTLVLHKSVTGWGVISDHSS